MCLFTAMRSATKWTVRGVIRQFVPILYSWYFDFVYTRRLRQPEQCPVFAEQVSKYGNVGVGDLEKAHEIELKRRAVVQQRVQGNAATIAVVTGLLAGALALLKDELFKNSDSLTTVMSVALTCVVVWLVMSGLSATRAVGIHPQCDHYLQTHDPANVPHGTSDPQKTNLLKMILLNQGYTLIITEYAMASHTSMRNAYLAAGGSAVAILWLR